MTLDNYQKEARKTAVYTVMGARFVYPALGLCGEAGEIAEKVKKVFRDNSGVLVEEKRQEMKLELGDVLWYVANLAQDIGFTLEEIGQANINKLYSRQQRGKLNGDGDKR